jgi:hypothetical protein
LRPEPGGKIAQTPKKFWPRNFGFKFSHPANPIIKKLNAEKSKPTSAASDPKFYKNPKYKTRTIDNPQRTSIANY